MIINDTVGAPVGASDLLSLKDKILGIKFSKTTWIMIIGACVIMIIERKLNIKPKKINIGG